MMINTMLSHHIHEGIEYISLHEFLEEEQERNHKLISQADIQDISYLG